LPKTGINWVSYDNKAWSMETWGDTAHLNEFGLDELP
jgi:hypothetical protein